MKIERVTFTGADNSVKPDQILRVVEEYPHIKIEWALLLSKSNEGKCTRYPSLAWMEDFVNAANPFVSAQKTILAGHLQGHWLRTMYEGKAAFPKERPTLWPYFQRIQLNFHGNLLNNTTFAVDGFYVELHDPFKQFIFQMDGVNEHIYHIMSTPSVNLVPLFDLSAGAGIVPDAWPKAIHPFLNGYAGGLGPNNLKEQLKRLEDTVGNGVIWIDMETRIRSDNDRLFDLDKCRRVLDVITELKP